MTIPEQAGKVATGVEPPGKAPVADKPVKDSVALRRLIEEIKVDKKLARTGYNRTYHRHNRS